MTSTEKIDAALDSVLRAGNLKASYSSSQELDRMRLAMQKIMADEYKAGSDAAHEAMKGK